MTDHTSERDGVAEDADACPICLEPFKADDMCATDITEGTCHAECLDGSPVVDLETEEPSDGPVFTWRYGDEALSPRKGGSDE